MKTILIPLDETEFSRQIFPHVKRLFEPQQYKVELLRVASPPAGSTEIPMPVQIANTFVFDASYEKQISTMTEQYRQEHESFKRAVQNELLSDGEELEKAGYQVTASVHFGNPVDEIVSKVELADIDLVAIATHARTGLGRVFLGSVAESALRRLSVPLLLIHPEDNHR